MGDRGTEWRNSPDEWRRSDEEGMVGEEVAASKRRAEEPCWR